MKIRFLRKLFPLLFLFLLVLFACRHESVPEKEESTQKIGLSSRTISLHQSKHRAKLEPKLKIVEQGFASSLKNGAFGKAVNFGDSITIDTEHIIYMEKGDFYNYTFKINRNNPEPNEPLENLVLVPTTDGNFQEYLVKYDITDAEKQLLKQGSYHVPHEKMTIKRIHNGTFSGSLFQEKDGGCTVNIYSSYTTCSEGVHSNGETNCSAAVRSQLITTFEMDCSGGAGGGGGDGGFGGGGETPGDQTGGGGESGSGYWDCPEPGIPSGPLSPNEDFGTGECNWIPTEPNEGNFETPCEKITASNTVAREFISKPKASTRKTEITATLSTDSEEKGFSYGVDSSGNEQVTGVKIGVGGNAVDVEVTNPSFTIIGVAHTHTPSVYNVPSVGDLYNMYKARSENPNFNFYHTFAEGGNDYVFTIVDLAKFNVFDSNFPKAMYLDGAKWKDGTSIGNDFKYIKDQQIKSGKTDDEAFDMAMAFVLKKYGTGIAMSKKDASGNYEPFFVKEQAVPFVTSTGTIFVKIYTKTTDCNY